MSQQQGMLQQADFYDNTGGLNLSDSPFKVKESQATGGTNYEYTETGGMKSRRGHEKANTVANSQLISLGLALFVTAAGVKTNLRAAGTQLQKVDVDAGSFTALTDDTVSASSTAFSGTSTQAVVFSQFNTPLINTMWAAGGGLTNLLGAYSATKMTTNGVPAPAGSIGLSQSAASATFPTTGTYYYGVAFRKASTQNISNVALDAAITLTAATNNVIVDLSTLTAYDTTKYDKVYIYRSSVGGSALFTTGSLIAQVNSGTASYTDTGTSITSASNVPRPDSTILDNSVLGAGTYNVLTLWKRRLVTAVNSTLYFSDLNKPESWPTANTITIPSGGPITGLGIISFSTDLSNDEYLAVFKERELWIITGSSISDWSLKFIDAVGCANQALILTANGFLMWVDYRGVFIWNGSSKPIYCSRPIEPLFDKDGDLDKSRLAMGCGQFSRKQNTAIWFLSHKIYGTQSFAIKMDLRLTLANVSGGLDGRMIDGCFLFDSNPLVPVYSALSYLPTSNSDEVMLLGDAAGYIYKGYNVYADAGAAYSFTYVTKYLDMGNPNTSKRFMKVIVWVEEVGDWNLYLDYWTNYKASALEQSTIGQPISTAQANTSALWDIAAWDTAYWDDYSPKRRAIVFNLSPGPQNNSEGDCLRLQFRQDTVNSPVTICGFSVIYAEKGLGK